MLRPRSEQPRAMIRDSVGDWQELSALYEQADGLEGVARAAWLVELEHNGHPLLRQLERMLAAREHVAGADFLEALPTIETPEVTTSPDWGSGSRVGPYSLIRHIGSGGMAEVWLASRA